LALCFKEQARRDWKESRHDELTQAQSLLQAHTTSQAGREKFFDQHANLLQQTLRQAEELDGYARVFSTRRLPKEQRLRLYFDKDPLEQAFRSLKGSTTSRPIRHWLYNRVIAPVFICDLAYRLLSLLNDRLKNIRMSPQEALREWDTMYKVYLRDPKKGFKISRVVTLTEKQKTILKKVNKKLLAHSE
jgi:transposase